jgi:hypothetical protein
MATQEDRPLIAQGGSIGMPGHRIDVASTPCRGSRFSVFVARAGTWEGANNGEHGPREKERAITQLRERKRNQEEDIMSSPDSITSAQRDWQLIRQGGSHSPLE